MNLSIALLSACLLTGCASTIEVTRTTTDIYMPTRADKVEVIKIPPTRPHKELADISAMQYPNGKSAEMWWDIRIQAAAIGADAVLVTDEQTFRRDFVLYRSVTGVALKWVP